MGDTPLLSATLLIVGLATAGLMLVALWRSEKHPLPSASHRQPAPWWAFGSVVLLAIITRVWGIDSWNISYDESIYFSQPGSLLFFGHSENETTPPLFRALSWAVVSLVPSFAAMRGIAALFGVITCALMVKVGEAEEHPWLGVAVGALVAMNPLQIVLSQTNRAYSVIGMLSAAALLCVVRFRKDGDSRWLAALGVCGVLGAWMSYFFVAMYLALTWTLLFPSTGERRLRDWRLAVVLAAPLVGLAAMLPEVFSFSEKDEIFANRGAYFGQPARFLKHMLVSSFGAVWPGGLLAAALSGLALWKGDIRARMLVSFGGLWIGGMIWAHEALSVPFFPRHLGLFFPVIVLGLLRPVARWRWALAGVSVVLAALMLTQWPVIYSEASTQGGYTYYDRATGAQYRYVDTLLRERDVEWCYVVPSYDRSLFARFPRDRVDDRYRAFPRSRDVPADVSRFWLFVGSDRYQRPVVPGFQADEVALRGPNYKGKLYVYERIRDEGNASPNSPDDGSGGTFGE